jgi:uncharacterized protein (TIRG00374 family)
MEKGKRKKVFIVTAMVAFFIVMVILLASAGVDVLDIIVHIDPPYFILSVTCFLGFVLAWGIKYYLLVKRRVRQAYFPCVLLANMSGNFVNVTTPSGRMAGEPVRAKMIASCYKVRFSRVFAASMVDKASLTIAMLILVVSLTIYASQKYDMPRLLQYLTGAFVLFWVLVGIISYLIFRNLGEKQSKKVGSLIHRVSKFLLGSRSRDRAYFIEKAKGGIAEFRSTFGFLAKNPIMMAVDIILGLLTYGFRFASAYMLFIATGHSVDFFSVAVVVMIAFAIGLMSQVPGMFGVGESTMALMYRAIGINTASAVAVAILTQMNSYIVEIGLGYVAMITMNFILARIKGKRSISSPG